MKREALQHPLGATLNAGSLVVCVSHGFQTNYERGFANGLAANGVDLTLITSDRSDAAGLHPSIRQVNLRGSQEENRPGWRKAANMLRYYANLLLYSVWRRQSVLHVIGLIHPPLVNGVLLGLWFRAWNRQYVLTVHNLLPHDRHTPAMSRWHRWAYRLPHTLVVHTRRMAEGLQRQFGVPTHKILVMEHGIEPLGLVLPPAAATVANPGQEGPVRLLVFGKVAPYKGLDVLLEAMKLYTGSRQLELLIAGGGAGDAYGKALRGMIERHPLKDSIRWRNEFIPEQEMPSLFAATDIVVLPYLHIDQSGVLFQALRFGVPVLATRIGEFERYVSPDVGEVVFPNDPTALIEGLVLLIRRLSQIERSKIMRLGQSYEWSTVVRKMADAYRRSG